MKDESFLNVPLDRETKKNLKEWGLKRDIKSACRAAANIIKRTVNR